MQDNTSTSHQPALQQILQMQRDAFIAEGAPTLLQRRRDLRKLRQAVLAKKHEISQAICADFGHRSEHETLIMEVMVLVMGIDYLYQNLRRFMRASPRKVALAMRFGRARVEYQPLGVIGIMSPWNYPFSLALMPLATALAAGNRAMIKPSEFTPRTSAVLQTLLAEIFTEKQVAVVQGDHNVGQAFSSLAFDHLLFTGSTSVGRAVMRAASENLVGVTLELGGKSPVLISKDQDLNRVATAIAYGKLANAGQTCVAPDYVLLPEQDVDAFVKAFDHATRQLYPQGPSSIDYTSIINAQHHQRLQQLLDGAKAQGAHILQVGIRPHEAEQRINTIAPTLVLEADEQMQIMQDEIFGPILPIKRYAHIDEAIAYINRKPRPLALYYFGHDKQEKSKVLSQTTSGNVTVNGTLTHYAQEDLPFGGVGSSGLGAYHGIEGFRRLSHAKGIFEQGRWHTASLLRAPFGRIADIILKVFLK
ncbi:coniferyl aldehyde dehydrogenase [Acinetobacter larvae]|uniref:Aldehyde dehydrogenase n=1 Tax=Acinetobacter larvae TaxID=1789224 RepID=A0A1B2M199_9GAMM|nr:coniferyl aldehyde dehydrogenase [Acinetobacter larvae]AOA58939.1 coniferyl aldehyde dehydrogenase [Acinetobacter larvae]